METITSLFSFLGESVPIGVVAVIAIQVYTLNEIRHIRKDLSNPITDTNEKIEKLSDRFDEQNKHFNNRFDRLYELLVAKKSKK